MNTQQAYDRDQAHNDVLIYVTDAASGMVTLHVPDEAIWHARLAEVPTNTNYVVVPLYIKSQCTKSSNHAEYAAELFTAHIWADDSWVTERELEDAGYSMEEYMRTVGKSDDFYTVQIAVPEFGADMPETYIDQWIEHWNGRL